MDEVGLMEKVIYPGKKFRYGRGWYDVTIKPLETAEGLVVLAEVGSANKSKPIIEKGTEVVLRRAYGKHSLVLGREVIIRDGSVRNEVIITAIAREEFVIVRTCVK
jgi:hypothetical protein